MSFFLQILLFSLDSRNNLVSSIECEMGPQVNLKVMFKVYINGIAPAYISENIELRQVNESTPALRSATSGCFVPPNQRKISLQNPWGSLDALSGTLYQAVLNIPHQ